MYVLMSILWKLNSQEHDDLMYLLKTEESSYFSGYFDTNEQNNKNRREKLWYIVGNVVSKCSQSDRNKEENKI
mgnify:CR=1 FL=1